MLTKILKRINALLDSGFASKEAKEKLAADVLKLKAEDQKAVGEDVEKVNDLPEDKPAEGDEDNDEESDDDVDEEVKTLFDHHAKRVEKSVKSEVKSWLAEQKDLSAKNAGIYEPAIKEKRKALSEHMREFTKAMLAGDDKKLKEMTTDATGTPFAGYTVDSELSAEVRHLVTVYGVARREMMAIPLSKGSYKANDLATDVTVYWVDEGSVIKSTQAVLGQETLELKKLGAIVTLTSELLEDTEIDFVAFLGSRVAEGFAQAEDQAFFIGDGSSTYGGFTGLLIASDVNEVTMTGTTFASMDAEDLLDMIDATPSGALANAKFFYHRTIKSILRKLKSTDGIYVYQAPSQTGPSTVWGYPEVLVEAMPSKTDTAVDTSFVLFGDLRKACILGFKASGLKMSRFNAGVVRNVADNADINLITTDREAVRWVERTGYIRIIPTAVTKLTTAASSA
ncbi:phage major capsid protein [Candidatus Fermentibacteria bacterium]|nr:MAG: phage major capsid protein [Candidatus Fermentibacteria bacterium]